VPAFTVEKTNMRLWNFNRAHVAVTDSFDIHKVSYTIDPFRALADYSLI